MNMMLRIFKDYFQGMEAREYLYDHIANRMKESLKTNGINEVFRDVMDEAEKLIQKSKSNYLN
jgi:Zn-dependent M32 family carboxypeptidase